ncbi:MAG: hypothetical protein LBQ12_08410, partial [Deltaproteobacteria bacterium]|nr:hypothetical protein [Deltaproteobacteria bacterium]
MEKSIDFYPNEECSIAREGEGLGDGRAVFTGMLRTGSREGIHFMAGIMVYAFYDPMSRNCSGLDSHPQLITRMGDGADVLRVPLHVMPGSMPLAERFLTDGRLRISGPDPKGVYFGGRGKKAYFNWLDSGGDAASPCKDPQFTLGAGLSAEAQAVLYNTYWFRKLLGSDMPELPHFAVYWEGIYLPRAALPRIANLDSLGLRAPYPEGKEPWERPLRYDPWADRPASSRRARKAPPGGTAAAKARPHAAAGGTAAAKARPYAAAGGTAAAKARPYAAAAGTAAAKGGPYAPSAATAAATGGPYAP